VLSPGETKEYIMRLCADKFVARLSFMQEWLKSNNDRQVENVS
jgi:hypothetical protein